MTRNLGPGSRSIIHRPLVLGLVAVMVGGFLVMTALGAATAGPGSEPAAADDEAAPGPPPPHAFLAPDLAAGLTDAAGSAASSAARSGSSGSVGSGSGHLAAAGDAAPPTRVRIPAIDVDARMIPLGLRDDGSIEVPSEAEQAGWWVDGPEPGETGPAVILGHVDSRTGPAVFHRLRDLSAGDVVSVDRQDGTTVSYRVTRIEQHAKDAFPTQAVYGPTEAPVLRLVTCGGSFDRQARSYDENVIVFAEQLTAPPV